MYREILKAGALVVLLAGCAGIARDGGGRDGPGQQVSARAASRWDALIAGDVAKAYGYLSPGTREVMSLDLYKKKTSLGKWKKASVETVSCEKDQCDVTVVVEYDYRDMKSIKSRLSEVWLLDGGEWWHMPRK